MQLISIAIYRLRQVADDVTSAVACGHRFGPQSLMAGRSPRAEAKSGTTPCGRGNVGPRARSTQSGLGTKEIEVGVGVGEQERPVKSYRREPVV